MSRLPLLAVPLLALGTWWAATGVAADDHAAIARAARAPFQALAQRDAGALCADFIPGAVDVAATSGSTCQAKAASVFAQVPASVPLPAASRPLNWTVSHISRHGHGATAVLRYRRGGCEGCHRLAGQGNAGPGPALDDVGSRLSVRQIVRALVNPRAPMPSFKNLPAATFQALVEFLHLLRRQ